MFKRITVQRSKQIAYYTVPKELFSETFASLSMGAKILYGLLLDRSSLSVKNGWVTDEGEVYIIFKRETAAKLLCLSAKTVGKLFCQLSQFGLIEDIPRGKNRANLIFVHEFTDDEVGAPESGPEPYPEQKAPPEDAPENLERKNLRVRVGKKFSSGSEDFTPQEGNFLRPSNTDSNNPDNSNPDNQSFFPREDERTKDSEDAVFPCIDFASVRDQSGCDDDFISGLERLLHQLWDKPSVTVEKIPLPRPEIRRRISLLTEDHIVYAIGRFNSTEKIVYPPAYMASILLKAPMDFALTPTPGAAAPKRPTRPTSSSPSFDLDEYDRMTGIMPGLRQLSAAHHNPHLPKTNTGGI